MVRASFCNGQVNFLFKKRVCGSKQCGSRPLCPQVAFDQIEASPVESPPTQCASRVGATLRLDVS